MQKNAQDFAVGTELIDYRHDFTFQEIDDLRVEHTNVAIEQENLEDELKAFKKVKTDEITSLKKGGKELRRKIRCGYETRMANCYLVPDFDEGIMNYVHQETGETIFYRKLRPNERQVTIMSKVG